MHADLDEAELVRRAADGDEPALRELFTRHQQRLERMVRVRLDPRVARRVDPADVVQEAYLEISQKFADYARDPRLPFFLWLRLLTGQKLSLVHRQHLRVKARDAGREVSLQRRAGPQASSMLLAEQLVGSLTTPSRKTSRAEQQARLMETLDSLEAIDREVLVLRHFEQLSNSETAQVLGIQETAACNRYYRALERLRGALAALPGGEEEFV